MSMVRKPRWCDCGLCAVGDCYQNPAASLVVKQAQQQLHRRLSTTQAELAVEAANREKRLGKAPLVCLMS